jgi:hypothetical protein
MRTRATSTLAARTILAKQPAMNAMPVKEGTTSKTLVHRSNGASLVDTWRPSFSQPRHLGLSLFF